MKLGRSALRYSVARTVRSSGGSYRSGRVLSLLAVPWGKRKSKPKAKS